MIAGLIANIMGVEQWMVIVGVVVLLFGGNKIPELMRGIGKGVGELQKGLEDGKRMLHESVHAETSEAPTKPVEPAPVKSEVAPAVEAAKPVEVVPAEHAVPRGH